MIHYCHQVVAGHRVFYREAGDPTQPTLLLLHGFPSSSHMFRNLTPQAEIDLEEVGDYIALDNPTRAISFIDSGLQFSRSA